MVAVGVLYLPIHFIILILIELTRRKTILENTFEIEPQPVALAFKNLSQYSSRSKVELSPELVLLLL